MTPKIKERLLNLGVSALTAFTAVFLSFALFSNNDKNVRIDDRLEDKASYDYVDQQDNIIKGDFNAYKIEHAIDTDEWHGSIIREFDEIKRNQESDRLLIIETIKENNR